MGEITRMFGVLIVLITYTKYAYCEESYQFFSGYHFEKQVDLIPFESSIPLLFTTELVKKPDVTKLNQILSDCQSTDVRTVAYCENKEKLKSLQDLLGEEFENNYPDATLSNVTISKRDRRGLTFLQEFFSWCCNMASIKQVSGIYENQKDLESHTNEIIDSVGEQFKNLVKTNNNLNNFTKDVQNLADKVHHSFRVVNEDMNRLTTDAYPHILRQVYAFTQQSWIYILYNYYQDNNRDIMEKCHLNILSEKLVKPQNLSQHLVELAKGTQQQGLRLAIPDNKIYLYYRLKLVKCKIFNNTLLVKMNVPLISKETQGEFYKALPTPVAWDNQICTLEINYNYVFRTKIYTKVIRSNTHSCDDSSFPLCQLPRQTLVTTKEQLCLHVILNSEKIEKLQEHCQYICEPKPNYPIITQLLPNKYLLTNVGKKLQLKCESEAQSHIFSPISTGTLEIYIPCNCSLFQDDLILITELKPCDAQDVYKPIAIRLIPVTWSRLKALKMFPLQTGIKHQFDNLTEILDSNWKINNPTFEVTAVKKIEHVSLKNKEFDIFNNTQLMFYILLIWSSILSIIILILIYCVHIQAIRMRVMIPERDYKQTAPRPGQ